MQQAIALQFLMQSPQSILHIAAFPRQEAQGVKLEWIVPQNMHVRPHFSAQEPRPHLIGPRQLQGPFWGSKHPVFGPLTYQRNRSGGGPRKKEKKSEN